MVVDSQLLSILNTIERSTWALVAVTGGRCHCCTSDQHPPEPPFAYTVGLTALGHPEIIVYGLPTAVAGHILNSLGERIQRGQTFAPGQIDHRTTRDLPATFVEATDVGDLVVVSQVYPSVEAIQVVWADPDGRFPWDDGYDGERYPQPMMGRPVARL